MRTGRESLQSLAHRAAPRDRRQFHAGSPAGPDARRCYRSCRSSASLGNPFCGRSAGASALPHPGHRTVDGRKRAGPRRKACRRRHPAATDAPRRAWRRNRPGLSPHRSCGRTEAKGPHMHLPGNPALMMQPPFDGISVPNGSAHGQRPFRWTGRGTHAAAAGRRSN